MSSANRSSQDGIDIRLALEILSARSAEAHTHAENGETGCHHHAPKNANQMGQTIDLNQDTTNVADGMENDSTTNVASTEETVEEKRERIQEERDRRRADMKQKLESMSVKSLINAVLEAQQQRVVTYRDYERGLDSVLETGNMTNYPTICAEATASFSVLSDSINVIRTVLQDKHQRHDLKKSIETLQNSEKEKLNLTAALHLERIREKSQQVDVNGDERITALLREGVSSLQGKIQACVEEINEVLEELRITMMEEVDEK